MMLLPALETLLPEESVSMVNFQHVPQAGPAPAPCESCQLDASLLRKPTYWADTEFILRYRSGVSRRSIEAASL